MNYAVSLVIIDTDTVTYDSRILLGIRRPETNPQHPDVASTPTQRVPGELFSAITTRIGLAPSRSIDRAGDCPILYAVQSIFSHKLGLADMQELDQIHFSAATRSIFNGKVAASQEGGKPISWAMAVIEVHLSSWRHSFPDTASYTEFDWVRVDELLTRPESGMVPMGGSGTRLVGGLCIESTAKWLREVLG